MDRKRNEDRMATLGRRLLLSALVLAALAQVDTHGAAVPRYDVTGTPAPASSNG